MRRSCSIRACLLVAVAWSAALPLHAQGPSSLLRSVPMAFVENQGQAAQSVRYEANGLGGTLNFSASGVLLTLPRQRGSAQVEVAFDGARSDVVIKPRKPLQGRYHFLLGNDSNRWVRNVRSSDGIVYRNVYPGIDLEYEGVAGRLKGTWHVPAHGDPSVIRWRYRGIQAQSIVASGDLVLSVRSDSGDTLELREKAPVAWQWIAGVRIPVAVQFELEDDGAVTFAIGTYRPDQPLVIDPDLVWSTYIGGSGTDEGLAMARSGNHVFITGFAHSTDVTASPMTRPWPNLGDAATGNPPVQTVYGGEVRDVVVMKLDVSQTSPTVIWSTRLGGGRGWGPGGPQLVNGALVYPPSIGSAPCGPGSNCQLATGGCGVCVPYGEDRGYAIAVDSMGEVIVGGETLSDDFPGTNSAPVGASILPAVTTMQSPALVIQPTHADNDPSVYTPSTVNIDGFLAKLTADGSQLVFSTYLGGTGGDRVTGVTVDNNDDIYVVGDTQNGGFAGLPPSTGCGTDGFLVKVDSTGVLAGLSLPLGQSNTVDLLTNVSVDPLGTFVAVAGAFADCGLVATTRGLTIVETATSAYNPVVLSTVPGVALPPSAVVAYDATSGGFMAAATSADGSPTIYRVVNSGGTWGAEEIALVSDFRPADVRSIAVEAGQVAITGRTLAYAPVAAATAIASIPLNSSCQSSFVNSVPNGFPYDGTRTAAGVVPPWYKDDAYVWVGDFSNPVNPMVRINTYLGGPCWDDGNAVVFGPAPPSGDPSVIVLGTVHGPNGCPGLFPTHNAICQVMLNYPEPMSGPSYRYNGASYGGGSGDAFLVKIQ